jgi:hypothetical protein
MWDIIIDFVQSLAGAVPMNIVFWAGAAVVGLALILGILRLALKRRVLPMCRYQIHPTLIIAWLYFVFALFAVTTNCTVTFSNLMVYMSYPLAVMILSYLLVWLFAYTVRCKIKCTAWQNFDFNEKPRTKKTAEPKEMKQAAAVTEIKQVIQPKDGIIMIEQGHSAEQEQEQEQERGQERESAQAQSAAAREKTAETVPGTNETKIMTEQIKEEPVKIITTDRNGKEVEVNLPEVEPIFGSASAVRTDVYAADADKIERISNLAEEIERRRQKNIKITDGEKENKFISRVGDAVVGDPSDPKVVVRRITEQVKVEPKVEEAPKTGFTYQRIIERRETENKRENGNVFASSSRTADIGRTSGLTEKIDLQKNSNSAFENISRDSTQTKKSAQDVLDAIARLRSTMDKK